MHCGATPGIWTCIPVEVISVCGRRRRRHGCMRRLLRGLVQVNWTALWAEGWQQQFLRSLLCTIPIAFIMCADPPLLCSRPCDHELKQLLLNGEPTKTVGCAGCSPSAYLQVEPCGSLQSMLNNELSMWPVTRGLISDCIIYSPCRQRLTADDPAVRRGGNF